MPYSVEFQNNEENLKYLRNLDPTKNNELAHWGKEVQSKSSAM